MYYSISKDLPTVEDTEVVVEKIIAILGPMGRILETSRNTKHNVKISVGKMDKIWYGDIDFIADVDSITKLEMTLGTTLEYSL